MFYLITQTTVLDYLQLNQDEPNLCTQETSDGGKVFTFCPVAPVE
ncbi:MAG: hypothetical protein WCV72_02235 [Patescibacteria group bacterium]